jgi:putative ABC transport system substrate-binding protein
MKKLLVLIVFFAACKPRTTGVPTIGFADAFEDNTIGQAKQGFLDALKDSGFSSAGHSLNVIYRNAQGNPIALTQIIKYFSSEHVDLIATCPSLATITAIQNTKGIPIFMMVSPTPSLMKVSDTSNLFGVGENQDYIDTSFALIGTLVHPHSGALSVGMIYNQSEPQSVSALQRLLGLASRLGVRLVYLPVNSSADVQLVTGSILHQHVDAFFANPDNTVFSSFETIVKSCNQAGVPIFTSEAGLVARGAVAAYGADIYQWGYQSGAQAAHYLRNRDAAVSDEAAGSASVSTPAGAAASTAAAVTSLDALHWELVKVRKRVYNPSAASRFGLVLPSNFQSLH